MIRDDEEKGISLNTGPSSCPLLCSHLIAENHHQHDPYHRHHQPLHHCPSMNNTQTMKPSFYSTINGFPTSPVLLPPPPHPASVAVGSTSNHGSANSANNGQSASSSCILSRSPSSLNSAFYLTQLSPLSSFAPYYGLSHLQGEPRSLFSRPLASYFLCHPPGSQLGSNHVLTTSKPIDSQPSIHPLTSAYPRSEKFRYYISPSVTTYSQIF